MRRKIIKKKNRIGSIYITNWKREWFIYTTLKALSKQRVVMVLQPGNVWVIEKALKHDEKTDANLKTCHLRGWVEPIEKAISKGDLTPKGELPNGEIFSRVGPVYRLTDSGWTAIHRTHVLFLFSVFLAIITLIVSLF